LFIEHKNKSQENPDKMENYLNGQVSPNQAQELKPEPLLDLLDISSGSSSSDSQHSPDQAQGAGFSPENMWDQFDPEKMEFFFDGQVSAKEKQEPGLDTSSGSSSSGASHHSPDQAQGAGYSPENRGDYFQKPKMENGFNGGVITQPLKQFSILQEQGTGLDTSPGSTSSHHSPDQAQVDGYGQENTWNNFQSPENAANYFNGQVSVKVQEQGARLDTSPAGSISSGASHNSPDHTQGAGYSPENSWNNFLKAPENAGKLENYLNGQINVEQEQGARPASAASHHSPDHAQGAGYAPYNFWSHNYANMANMANMASYYPNYPGQQAMGWAPPLLPSPSRPQSPGHSSVSEPGLVQRKGEASIPQWEKGQKSEDHLHARSNIPCRERFQDARVLGEAGAGEAGHVSWPHRHPGQDLVPESPL